MTNTTTHTPQDKHELLNRDWGFLRIINYRGVLVEKILGGYVVIKKTVVSTPEEVDKVIDEAAGWLNESIKQ